MSHDNWKFSLKTMGKIKEVHDSSAVVHQKFSLNTTIKEGDHRDLFCLEILTVRVSK